MTTEKVQSDLAEVKDQLSLDYADGKYLNVVGNNYGLRRSDVDVSSLNFNDNTWRALVKVIALQYKQVLTKFEQVLDIILGPKITQVGTFTASIAAGVQSFQVNTDLQFPQVGTLILDEGLATEETVEVCFIDRYNNIVYLTAVTQFAHQLEEADAEGPLVLDMLAGDTEVYIPFSERFPTTDFPYTLVLGRGTPNEEVVQLLGNDIDNHFLTISACLNSHSGTTLTQIQNTLSADYVPASHFLSLFDVTKFDESGVVLLGASANQYTATGGNVGGTTATVAASTFTANRHVRSRVLFDAATTTPALRGVEAEIVINTDTTLTFLTPLPAQVVAGDLFNIRAVLEYVSVNTSDIALNLRRDIVDIELVASTTVEMAFTETLVSLGSVKMPGAGWDIYQTDIPGGPPTVEILFPTALRDPGELRGSSYLHPVYIDPPPTTALAGAQLADALVYEVTTTVGLPTSGTLTLDDGGADEYNITYTVDHTSTTEFIATGATEVTLDSGGFTFEVPFTAEISDGISTGLVTVSAILADVATISATASDFQAGADFRAVNYIRAGVSGSPNAYVGAELCTLYEPRYAGLSIVDGNVWTVDDTWPGPYLYDPTELGIQQINQGALVPNTTLNQFMVAGPSKVMISQQATRTALEIEDASAMTSASFPANLVIGTGGPNRETVDVNSLALRQRTFGLVNAPNLTNVSSIILDNLDELTTGFSAFPDANGYRVRIDEGGVNDEILFVTAISGGNTLTFENATQNPHTTGEVVRLMADVLAIDPLTGVHNGVYDLADREIQIVDPLGPNPGFPTTNNGQYFSDIRYESADIAQLSYGSFPILNTLGLPLAGSELYFNFGDERIDITDTLTVAASGTFAVPVPTLTATPTPTFEFPSSADSYPYVITVEPGTVREEVVEVLTYVPATGVFTLVSPLLFTHPIGSKVTFIPGTEDTVEYQSVNGSDIEFSPQDIFSQTFYAGTPITLSPGLAVPQITGYDFPLFMPADVEEALRSVLNLVRAAGVLVTFIDQP